MSKFEIHTLSSLLHSLNRGINQEWHKMPTLGDGERSWMLLALFYVFVVLFSVPKTLPNMAIIYIHIHLYPDSYPFI